MIVERGKFIFINFVIAVLLLCFFGAFDSLMATCCNDEPKATNLPSFYWGTATIAGEEVQVGDEVRAYVDSVTINRGCVGKAAVETPGYYGAMAVYGDDPTTDEKDGVEDGDTIYFVICRNGIEYDCNQTSVWNAAYVNELIKINIYSDGEVEKMCFHLYLSSGWSMISLPVVPDKATLKDLFPEAVVLYKFQKEIKYVRVAENEDLEIGKGYWILLNTPQLFIIRGKAITEYTIPVEDGWIIIGGCTSSAQRKVNNGNCDIVYGFNQEKGYIRISEPDLLEPGKAYWILFRDTSEGAEFTVSTSASQ